jgi:uncharacterized membrane protein
MKKRFLWWSILLFVLALAATLLMYRHLPDRIPAHWNAAGQIDRYGPRGWLFVHPAILGIVVLAWLVLPGVSPEQFRVGRFSDTYWFCGMVLTGLVAYIQGVMLWGTWTATMEMTRAMLGGLGVFIILLGNVMGKVRRNFWLGVRTPWTLASERVWYATHRLAAKTMVAGGLAMMLAALAGLPFYVGIGALLAAVLVPAAYSLVYYKRLEGAGGA